MSSSILNVCSAVIVRKGDVLSSHGVPADRTRAAAFSLLAILCFETDFGLGANLCSTMNLLARQRSGTRGQVKGIGVV